MSDRPSRIDVLMEQAIAVSKRSTCQRLNVGAIISRDGRPITTGYNGPPAGFPHCNHPAASGAPCDEAIHAEANAIAFAAKWGVATDNATLVSTHMPCIGCARMIVNAGITEVWYQIPYRITTGVILLHEAGLVVRRYDGSSVTGWMR